MFDYLFFSGLKPFAECKIGITHRINLMVSLKDACQHSETMSVKNRFLMNMRFRIFSY